MSQATSLTPENITNATFEKAVDAMRLSAKESKQSARDLIEKVLAATEESTDKNWKLA